MEPDRLQARPVRLSPHCQRTPVDGHSDAYSALADDSSQSEELKQAFMLISVAEDNLADGDAGPAKKAAEDALKIFRDSQNSKGVADALRIQIGAHCLEEDTNEGRRVAKEELAVFQSSGDQRGEAAMQLSLADVSLAEGRLDEAFKDASGARELFNKAGDSKMEAVAFLTLARIRTAEEMSPEAVRMANAALLLFQKAGDSKNRARGLVVLTGAYLTAGATKEALQSAEAAASLFFKLGCKKDEAYQTLQMSMVNMGNHKFQEATNLAKKAQTIFRNVGFMRGEHLALDLLVKLSLQKGHHAWALTLAKEGAEKFQRAGEARWETAVLGDTMLQVLIEKESLEEAKEAAEAALALCRGSLKDRRWEAKLLENLATVHLLKQDYEEASASGLDACSIFEELGAWKNAGEVRYKLSNGHHLRGDHSAACDEAKEARSLFKKAGCRASEATALLGMCFAHQMQLDLQKAEETALEAVSLAEDADDKKGQAAAWLNIGSICLFQENRFGEAVPAAAKAEALLREHGTGEKLLGDTLHFIAQVYLVAKEPDSAARPAHEARIIYQRIKEAAAEADALRLLAHIDHQLLLREINEPQPDSNKHWKTIARLQATAVKSAEDAVAGFRKINSKFALGAALHTLAQVRAAAQDGPGAVTAADEATEIFHLVGERFSEANALVITADACLMAGERQRATDAANTAAAIFRDLGDEAGEKLAMSIFEDISGTPADTGLAAIAQSAAVAKRPKVDFAAVRRTVIEKAMEMLAELDEGDLSVDTPLMDAGLDSLAVIGFRDALSQAFPGINLPAEMTFDYPTAHAVAGFIVESMEALP